MMKTVSALLLVLAICVCGTAQAAYLTVLNPSFEAPVQSPTTYSTSVVTDWSVTGAGGVWYAPWTIYFSMPVPDGNQVLWLNGGIVSQTLSEALTAGLTYTLKIDVGHRTDPGQWDPSYNVELLAGSHTLVSGGSFDPGAGQFGTLTLSYTAALGDPNLGNALGIQLSNTAKQTDFDNVRLETSAVPLPSGLLLLGPALVGFAAVRRTFKK